MTHYVNKCIYGKINTMSHNIYHFSNPNKFQTKYTWKSNIYRYTKTPIILAKKDHTSINPSLQINKQRGGLGAKNYLINRVWWRGNNGSKSSEGGVYGIIVGCNIRTLSCFHIWSFPQNFTWCYHLFLHFHSSRISLLFPSVPLSLSKFLNSLLCGGNTSWNCESGSERLMGGLGKVIAPAKVWLILVGYTCSGPTYKFVKFKSGQIFWLINWVLNQKNK